MDELLMTAIKASIKAGEAIMKVYASKDFEISHKSDWSPLTLADRNAHDEIVNILKVTGYPILSEEGTKTKFEERKKWDCFWLVDPLDGTKEFIKRNGEFTVNIALIINGKPVMGVIYVPVERMLYFGEESKGAFKLQLTIDNGQLTINKTNKLENLIALSTRLPVVKNADSVNLIASRSHVNFKTILFINKLKKHYKNVNIISKGSSLKLCLIAEGNADVYPRHSPTMEWDTAAGHAIINASGGRIIKKDSEKQIEYNKENLLNPGFTAYRAGFEFPF